MKTKHKKNGKDAHNRTMKMKVSDDILEALFCSSKHIDITCVSLKWKKTIKVAPEEVPDLVLIEKVVEMESKFKLFEEDLSELRVRQVMKEEQHGKPLMSEVVTGEAKAPRQVIPDREPIHVQSQTDGRGFRLSQTSSPAVRQQSNNDGFIFPAYNRRRLVRQAHQEKRGQDYQPELQQKVQSSGRRHCIIGQANENNGLHATPMPSRDFCCVQGT